METNEYLTNRLNMNVISASVTCMLTQTIEPNATGIDPYRHVFAHCDDNDGR